MGHRRTSLQGGVTLIEFAVAVIVIALIVAIGIPTYRHHVLRLKSVDAPRELRTLALRLEGCLRRTGSYSRMDDAANACVGLPYSIPEGTYTISGDIGVNTFLLTATPLGGQSAESQCRAFTLDQQGRQGITGTGSAQDCWGVRQN